MVVFGPGMSGEIADDLQVFGTQERILFEHLNVVEYCQIGFVERFDLGKLLLVRHWDGGIMFLDTPDLRLAYGFHFWRPVLTDFYRRSVIRNCFWDRFRLRLFVLTSGG